MKRTGKVLGFLATTMLLAISVLSCDTGTGGNGSKESEYGPTNFYGSFTFGSGQQIWAYNREWTRVSDVYQRFTEDRDVIVFVSLFDEDNEKVGEATVGTGTITGGILNFSVEAPDAEFLFGWQVLKSFDFFYWKDVVIDAPGVMGNGFKFRTTRNERLNLELITGSRESISQEVVRFIYVDRPARVTGSASADGIIEGSGEMTSTYFYTENDLDVYLEKGWNTIYRKQTFYTGEKGDGRSGITVLVKNPLNFKWVLYPENYDGEDRDEN